MTSRRCMIIEDGAREQLQMHGYTVRVIPPGFQRKQPPGDLLAIHQTGESRLIRVRKITNQPSKIEYIEKKCRVSIRLFRKHMARHNSGSGFHYEIWIYTLSYGFRCFEVLRDQVREIPKFPLHDPAVPWDGGVV